MPGQKIIFLDLAEPNRRKQNSFIGEILEDYCFTNFTKFIKTRNQSDQVVPKLGMNMFPKYVTFTLENLATPFQQTPNLTIIFGKTLSS